MSRELTSPDACMTEDASKSAVLTSGIFFLLKVTNQLYLSQGLSSTSAINVHVMCMLLTRACTLSMATAVVFDCRYAAGIFTRATFHLCQVALSTVLIRYSLCECIFVERFRKWLGRWQWLVHSRRPSLTHARRTLQCNPLP